MADEKKTIEDENLEKVNGGGWFSNLWEKTKSTGKLVKPAAVVDTAGQLKKETIAEDMLDDVSGGAGVKDYKLGGATVLEPDFLQNSDTVNTESAPIIIVTPEETGDMSVADPMVGMTNFVPGK